MKLRFRDFRIAFSPEDTKFINAEMDQFTAELWPSLASPNRFASIETIVVMTDPLIQVRRIWYFEKEQP